MPLSGAQTRLYMNMSEFSTESWEYLCPLLESIENSHKSHLTQSRSYEYPPVRPYRSPEGVDGNIHTNWLAFYHPRARTPVCSRIRCRCLRRTLHVCNALSTQRHAALVTHVDRYTQHIHTISVIAVQSSLARCECMGVQISIQGRTSTRTSLRSYEGWLRSSSTAAVPCCRSKRWLSTQKAMQRQAQTATAPAHCSLTAHKLRSIRAFLTLRRLEVLISNQNLPLRRWACAHHFHRIAIGDSGRRAHAMCVQTMHAHAHEQAHARAHAHAHEQVHAGN